jgi:hypothetical protein
MIRTTAMSLALLATAGCAAIQIPADRLERNEASIRAAQELGGESVPAARLHVQLAKDQTQTAKKLAADGDERAVLMLSRAEADAELALGLAREATVQQEASRAADELKAVKARGNPSLHPTDKETP